MHANHRTNLHVDRNLSEGTKLSLCTSITLHGSDLEVKDRLLVRGGGKVSNIGFISVFLIEVLRSFLLCHVQ